ncbi:MAG: hypothetical protein ACXW3U_15735 [Rhodoplanes sp.]
MSDSDNLRKLALERLRLAAECTQLAGEIRNPALQSYFIRMAGVWTAEAEQGLRADTRPPT